jgi:hypothetical protein
MGSEIFSRAHDRPSYAAWLTDKRSGPVNRRTFQMKGTAEIDSKKCRFYVAPYGTLGLLSTRRREEPEFRRRSLISA